MSNEDFEKGLNLLLNSAYNIPAPDEGFRGKLLEELKERQRVKAGVRRSRIITLYSSFSAVAAVVVFAFLPNINIFSATEPNTTTSSTQVAAIDNSHQDNIINTDNLLKQSESSSQNIQLASYSASDNSFIPVSAQALNPIDVYNPQSNKWATIENGDTFPLTEGTQVRTPLGATESVNFTINEGPSVMLDGMSQVALQDNTLVLEDGRAVISVNPDHNPMTLQLGNQDIDLHPGAMVFATLDNDNSYTDNGIPAPMLVLLQGNATSDNNGHNSELAQGRVYELFDTGTGRYPSRKVGSYENKRQFIPMIDAVQATYKTKE